ncbi:unnamed protein product [Linum trigynum]|uniref:Uncharacterized protein n=1 Tax=Linum trigynum TaxID=586398 RepID=A0AAV2F4I7_9ROSI
MMAIFLPTRPAKLYPTVIFFPLCRRAAAGTSATGDGDRRPGSSSRSGDLSPSLTSNGRSSSSQLLRPSLSFLNGDRRLHSQGDGAKQQQR